MPKKNHIVSLTEAEMASLKSITHKGSGESARTIMHANILLLTNDCISSKRKTVREIAELFDISPNTVNQVRSIYASEGLEAAINRKTRLTPPHVSKITGDFEAHVIATALSPAPKGRDKWTLRLLAEYCMEKQYIVTISHSAIGDMLNTNHSR
jgi:transposase